MSTGMASHTIKGSKDGQITCPIHCRKVLEFYCPTCKKSACKRCEHFFNCFRNKHKLIEMKVAVNEFNENATELIKTADEIKNKLHETFHSIIKDRSNFDNHLKSCRAAIKHQEETLIKIIQEKSKALMADLEKRFKAKIKDHDNKIKVLESKQTQVNNLEKAINALINKPEERESLEHHKKSIKTIRDMVIGNDFDKTVKMMNITPHFIPSKNLQVLMNTEGVGEITTANSMTYKVAEDDKAITVRKEQPFVVTVSSLAECDACKLAATLKNSSGEESATEIEYQGNGEYKIMGRCNEEGDWQMKITVAEAHIKGSPVIIKISADKAQHILEGSKDRHFTCPTHCSKLLEFFCSTCKKLACKQCDHVFDCLQNHKVIKMKKAVDEFNQNAIELIKISEEIKNKLQETFDYIHKDRSNFDNHLKLCRTAIEHQQETLIKKIQEKSRALMADLEKRFKTKIADNDTKIKDLELKQTQVNTLTTAINALMNKPEERENLELHKTTINTMKDELLGFEFKMMNIIPSFISSKHLNELINTEDFGEITTVDSMMYKVDKDDEALTATKGQPFILKVSSQAKCDAYKLAATLKSPSGQQSQTAVEYQGCGRYKITGRCNEKGGWQMEITVAGAHIKGSPVNVKVMDTLGLVHTIDIKEHTQTNQVTDVGLYKDGCILLSSYSKRILKFSQSGSIVSEINWEEQKVQINRMHVMGDGHMVCSNGFRKCVIMYDAKFKKIHSFGKKILKYPEGLAVNKETRILYVADREAHCVFKFDLESCKLLGKIGSQGREEGQMNKPQDVTLTKEGHVIVADFLNCRIQMFDVNDKFMRTLISSGRENGKVWAPYGVTMDKDENIIVSSFHKLQLFNKDGVYIKRIDHEDDGLDIPLGITVISNRPRRVAVANHKANNVKIFNY